VLKAQLSVYYLLQPACEKRVVHYVERLSGNEKVDVVKLPPILTVILDGVADI